MSLGNKKNIDSTSNLDLIKKLLNLNNPYFLILNDKLDIIDFSAPSQDLLQGYLPLTNLKNIFDIKDTDILNKSSPLSKIETKDRKLGFKIKLLQLEPNYNILSLLPVINNKHKVQDYNLNISEINQLSYLPEYIFLYDTTIGSFADYDRIYKSHKEKNNELRSKNKEILLISRFPMENPSPVIRIKKDGTVLYQNHSNFLENYCTLDENGRIKDEQFLSLLNTCANLPSKRIDTVMKRNGSYLNIHVSFSEIYDDFNVYITDVTEYTDNLNKLRQFYEDILDDLPVDVAVFNKKREFIYLNKKAVSDDHLRKYLIGKTEKDYFDYRKKDYSKIAENRTESFKALLKEEREPQWVDSYEEDEIHILRTLKAIYKKGTKEIDKIVGTGVNISSRVRAEKKLGESEKKWSNIIKSSSDLIMILDENCKTLFISDSVKRLLGFTTSEMLGINFNDLIHPDDLINPIEAFKIDSYSDQSPKVFRVKNIEGVYIFMRISIACQDDIIDKPCLIINGQDISAIKKLEAQRYATSIVAEEKERRRIAQDLHDGVGQYLATTSLYTHVLETYAERELSEQGLEVFHKLRSMLKQAVDETRAVSHNIMPSNIKDFGLIQSIEHLIENLNQSNPGVIFEYKKINPDNIKQASIAEEFSLNLFRSIQQIFNNSLTHGQPSKIITTFKINKNRLELSIKDNGIGFNSKSNSFKNGIGIKSIIDRITNLGGEIKFHSKINVGTTVTFKINLALLT